MHRNDVRCGPRADTVYVTRPDHSRNDISWIGELFATMPSCEAPCKDEHLSDGAKKDCCERWKVMEP